MRDRDLEICQLKAQLAIKQNSEWERTEQTQQFEQMALLLQESQASRAQLQDKLANTQQADDQSSSSKDTFRDLLAKENQQLRDQLLEAEHR